MNSDKFRSMRQRVIDLQNEEDHVRTKRTLLQRELQAHCIHGREIECEPEVLSDAPGFDVRPAMRLCVICGVEEEEQGDGFKVLKSARPKRVGQEEFFLLRVRLTTIPEF